MLTTTQSRISLFIIAKRRDSGLGVREAATQCGISAATLSRLERGISVALPDAGTLTKLAGWLGTSVSGLLGETPPDPTAAAPPTSTTPEIVEVHLRADKNLSPKTAHALSEMFKALYEQVASKPAK